MCLSTLINCRSEGERSQLLDHVGHVVIEVPADHDRCIWVLSDDVPDYFSDSTGSLLQVRLFSWLEIAVENLNICAAELELGPAKIRT